ncbi:MAG: hypothetical protein QW514_07150 [Thermoprotei archaeon]
MDNNSPRTPYLEQQGIVEALATAGSEGLSGLCHEWEVAAGSGAITIVGQPTYCGVLG